MNIKYQNYRTIQQNVIWIRYFGEMFIPFEQ